MFTSSFRVTTVTHHLDMTNSAEAQVATRTFFSPFPIQTNLTIVFRHFCYICGGMIVQSVVRREIDEGVANHYSSGCILFDVPPE